MKTRPNSPTPTSPALSAPWSRPADEILSELRVDSTSGLSAEEVQARLVRYGPNQLRTHRRRSAWRVLASQFTNLVVGLLVGAAIAGFAFGENVEATAVLTVVAINAAIGFVTEMRAVRSMEALRQLGTHATTVRRAGTTLSIPSSELVPGDIVVLDAGDVLTADLRIVTGSHLQVDESTLTGESLPVAKTGDAVTAGTALPERSPMLHKGTAITRGSGEAVVVATGMSTELGQISALIEQADEETTPLEKRLESLARRLIGLTVVIAAVVAIVSVVSGRGLVLSIEIGIALAVATIPEGLPIVATVALARGMWRMAQRNALVDKLSAVETLGSTTIILTDKTGTLTENRMTVVELELASGRYTVGGTGLESTGDFVRDGASVESGDATDLTKALRVAVLCNNATFTPGATEVSGDPTEVALLVVGAKASLARSALLEEFPEVNEYAFDPDAKRMATIHSDHGQLFAAVKGAPEVVLDDCSSVFDGQSDEPLTEAARIEWRARADEMAARGERLLALATRSVPDATDFDYQNLTLLGLIGFVDPPRASVRPAIETCQSAGIRVVMVTGDHGATGWNIAGAVGLIDPQPGETPSFVDGRAWPDFSALSDRERKSLLEATVIARATPRQKIDLVELHQQAGQIVAMTGDGVNDAPALEKANIGVAMGQRGTQVAREAADMVLQDDEFGTIVAAVEQGRTIFANLRKFVIYLMSCNVSEIFVVGLGALIPGPLPILPLQILFLNLVTDVFPALALGVCEGSPAIMSQRPRDPAEPILTRRHWTTIFALGFVMAVSVLSALGAAQYWLDKPPAQVTTITFLTLAMAQIWHAFSMRNSRSAPFDNEVTRNRWVWGATALCLILLVGAVHLPFFASVLSVENPGLDGWLLAFGFSLVPLLVGQLALLHRRRS